MRSSPWSQSKPYSLKSERIAPASSTALRSWTKRLFPLGTDEDGQVAQRNVGMLDGAERFYL